MLLDRLMYNLKEIMNKLPKDSNDDDLTDETCKFGYINPLIWVNKDADPLKKKEIWIRSSAMPPSM